MATSSAPFSGMGPVPRFIFFFARWRSNRFSRNNDRRTQCKIKHRHTHEGADGAEKYLRRQHGGYSTNAMPGAPANR